MSRRQDAPYKDQLDEAGTVLIYEGHDISEEPSGPDPKTVDQPEFRPDGRLTDNGKFLRAAAKAKAGEVPEQVRVYEKIKTNIWVFNGIFELLDAWKQHDGKRGVFRFKLRLLEKTAESKPSTQLPQVRVIPSAVKVQVWKRDGGKCVRCGATDNLHFDHVLPFAKGGTSLLIENIQILCARHNIAKRDRIE